MQFFDVINNRTVKDVLTEIEDFDKGGGIFVPSSLTQFDNSFFESLKNLQPADRVQEVFLKCFGIEFDNDACVKLDLDVANVEEGVYVVDLHLSKLKLQNTVLKPLFLAAAFVSCCVDIEEESNVFVPLVDCDLVLGALIAKDLGAPIKNIVVATSENNEFVHFVNSGKFDANKQPKKTYARDLDAQIPANFKRLVAYLQKDEAQLIKDKFETFDKTGVLALNCNRGDLLAGSCLDDEIKLAINAFWETDDVLFDPSTAAAASLFDEYAEETEDEKGSWLWWAKKSDIKYNLWTKKILKPTI